MTAEEAYEHASDEIRAALEAAENGDGRGMAELYRQGVSTNGIATIAGWNANRVAQQLRNEGVEIRPGGRPRKVAELFPSEASRQTLHNQYAPKIEPRYSCGHKRIPSYPQCRVCDCCQCTPRKQSPVRRYSGGWLCRCGKVIEP